MNEIRLFLKNFKWQSFWIVISSFLINILALSSALYVIQVFNRYLTYKIDSTLIILTVGVLLAVTMEFLLRLIRGILVNKISIISKRDMSTDSISKALSFKLSSHKILSDKKILDYLSPDLNSEQSSTVSRIIALIDIFFVVLFIVTITLLSIKIGIISCLLAIIFLVIIKLKIFILRRSSKIRNSLANKTNTIFSDIKLLSGTIRAFNAQSIIFSRFKLFFARQRRIESSFKNIISFFDTFTIMIPVFGTILIIFFGAQEVINNKLTVGALVGMNILAARIYGPLGRFSLFSNDSREYKIFENSLKKELVNEDNQGMNPKILKGNISLKNITIGFDNNKDTLFQRLNCNIPTGSVVVINGYNSSGKTSLCKCLLGLIKPKKGTILYDNIDLNKIDIKWLRKQFSYLPQEIKLFNLSLKDNILINIYPDNDKIFNENELDGILLKTIDMVGLDQYVNNLSAGINTIVTENGKYLPVGIKKRIGLARAIINDGKCLILDEPSESLDTKGVSALYKILNNARSLKKTIIIASHDPNILKSAGIIIDLSSKPIPRIGTRKKAINKNA